MWAQSWLNLLDICEPYPSKPDIDITPQLREKVIINLLFLSSQLVRMKKYIPYMSLPYNL